MCNAKFVSLFKFNISIDFSRPFYDFLFLNTQVFASNCRNAKYIPITDEFKQLFIDVHNKLRNEQALGKTGHIFTKTVADMASVVSIRLN